MATSMLNTIRCSSGNGTLCSRMLAAPLINFTPVMHHSRKHWNPLYRRLRREKTLFIKKEEEPNWAKLSPPDRRMEMKKLGIPTGLDVKTREINITTTDQVYSDYVPREAEGKKSRISKDIKATTNNVVKEPGRAAINKMRAKGKIRKYDNPDFTFEEIAPQLQNIYMEAQKLLTDVDRNQDLLCDFVTLNAFKKMTSGLEKTTVEWEFVESIEPPRVVNAAAAEFGLQDNYFAQITLRVYIRQKLAIYDRFGRLMYGDPNLVKDVLEYIVFENHITSIHGRWRVHDKIVPSWWNRESEEILKSYVEEVDQD